MATTAMALTINDSGVVGTIDAENQNASLTNVTDWANHLLGMDDNASKTIDGNSSPDGVTEIYQTSNTNYDGTVSGGIRINESTPDVSSYEWVVAKYNGQNAGYVMFNVNDATTIPEYSYSIWGNDEEQYQLSNITGYGTSDSDLPVPDSGATVALMGIALAGLGFLKRCNG